MSTSAARPQQDPLETCILRDDDVTSGEKKDAERSKDSAGLVCSIGQYYVIYTFLCHTGEIKKKKKKFP